ncbi:unnamed protein product [Dovyalis caffra]|uniref:Uncharacterized protein n=1 Tax=Dovyalis caffra TaxID=77055 RepID=A0AAV1SNQ5_9ROSI|nr:unnamed protein product [Dovyalis caffra]
MVAKDSHGEEYCRYDRERAQERLSKLSGGVAVFKVGGASAAEVRERKDRLMNALTANRAAVEEGIVPGDGVAFLYCTKALENLQAKNQDGKEGIQIIQNALKVRDMSACSSLRLYQGFFSVDAMDIDLKIQDTYLS